MIFDFNEQYILEDDLVILRPLIASDYLALLHYTETEPELWCYNAYGPDSPAALRRYLHSALLQRRSGKEYAFIVVDKLTGKCIGATRFYNIRKDNNTLDLGYTWYGKAWQGTNINRRCKYLLLSFAFNEMGVDRIGFAANDLNERSKAAMKGIGCIQEGVLRNNGTNAKGERIDTAVFSIIKDDWFDHTQMMLRDKIFTNIKK